MRWILFVVLLTAAACGGGGESVLEVECDEAGFVTRPVPDDLDLDQLTEIQILKCHTVMEQRECFVEPAGAVVRDGMVGFNCRADATIRITLRY